MDVYNWARIPEEKMNPLVSRQVIHTPQMTIARIRLARGAVVPLHEHANEQVTMMQSGALRFEIAGEEVVVRGGPWQEAAQGGPWRAAVQDEPWRAVPRVGRRPQAVRACAPGQMNSRPPRPPKRREEML